MKFEKQVSLIWAIALVLIACLVSSSIVYFVFGVSPSSTPTISGGIYPGAPSYTVWCEGSNYFAKDANGEIDYSGTNASQIINNALNALTSGRTWKEKVLIKGDITLTHDIIMPSYTHLEILGRIFLASGTNRPIIRNKDLFDGNTFLEVSGSGILDGNKAGQTIHNCSDQVGVCGIDFENSTNIVIRDITIKDTNCDGIAIMDAYEEGKGNIIITGVTSYNNYMDGIALLKGVMNATISNCVLYSNGRAGIVLDGQSLPEMISRVTVTNNVIGYSKGEGSISGGIILEYGVGLVISNNIISNIKGSTYEGFGIEGSVVRYSIISNNWIYNCNSTGIFLQYTSYDNVIEGNFISIVKYGIVLYNSDRNSVINNWIELTINNGIQNEGSSKTLISQNNLRDCGGEGNDADSIYVTGSVNVTISCNKAWRGDRYEINIVADCTGTMVFGNDLRSDLHVGDLNDSGIGTKKHDNLGDSGWLAET